MTIICKMLQCPYWDKEGFCGKGIIKIDENGMCSVPWKKGVRRVLEIPFTDEKYPKRKIEIINAEEYEIKKPQTIEEIIKEEGGDGTNSEDPTNGTAASKNE